MSVLSWGKCSITTTTSQNGAPTSNWSAVDTPKENTTKLTATAGTEKTATEEGGGIVDAYFSRGTYQLEFDLFVKKGGTRKWDDDDGIISGEHAFRVTPEDESCEGIQVDRGIIRVEESYSTEEGKMLHYVVRCLKPATGKTVKPYTKSA